MDYLYCVREQRDAMGLNEAKHHHIIGKTINSENGVGASVEFLDAVHDCAVKRLGAFRVDAQVQ